MAVRTGNQTNLGFNTSFRLSFRVFLFRETLFHVLKILFFTFTNICIISKKIKNIQRFLKMGFLKSNFLLVFPLTFYASLHRVWVINVIVTSYLKLNMLIINYCLVCLWYYICFSFIHNISSNNKNSSRCSSQLLKITKIKYVYCYQRMTYPIDSNINLVLVFLWANFVFSLLLK